MSWTTPDLCDQYPDVQVAEPVFRGYGGRNALPPPSMSSQLF